MKCPYPVTTNVTPTGSGTIAIKVPCGQCICCRIRQRSEKAMRLHVEALNPVYGGKALWITLTYAPEHYPEDGSVSIKEMQNWMKRVRQNLGIKGLRYAYVGEYGSKTGRAHYHAVLFGINDIYVDKLGRAKSRVLDATWTKGHYYVDNWSVGRSDYLAGYITKKFVTESNDDLAPEFYRASKHPMLGAWIIPEIAKNIERYIPDEMKQEWYENRTVPSLLKISGKTMPMDTTFKKKLREALRYPQDDYRRLWSLKARQQMDPSLGWEPEYLKEQMLSNGQKKLKARLQREKL